MWNNSLIYLNICRYYAHTRQWNYCDLFMMVTCNNCQVDEETELSYTSVPSNMKIQPPICLLPIHLKWSLVDSFKVFKANYGCSSIKTWPLGCTLILRSLCWMTTRHVCIGECYLVSGNLWAVRKVKYLVIGPPISYNHEILA